MVRAWRYRIRDEEAYGSPVQGAGKRRRRNQMLIVNAVAIDRSDDTVGGGGEGTVGIRYSDAIDLYRVVFMIVKISIIGTNE